MTLRSGLAATALLAGSVGLGLCVSPATAAQQNDNVDDASTTPLLAGNRAKFTGAIGLDEVFTVGDGVNVGDNGTVVSAGTADGVGTLTFLGDSTATGTIGNTSNRLGILNAGVAGKAVTITGNVFAVTSNVSGTGTLNFQGNLTGILDYDADGLATIADAKNLTGTVTTSAGDNTGTLTLEGTTTVSGQVGTAPASLKVVNGGVAGKVATFSADVFAQTLNVTGTGTVDLDGNFTGILDFDQDGTATIATTKNLTGTVTNSSGAAAGTLTFEGITTTGGTIGSIATAAQQLKDVNFNGGTASVGHDIGATTIDIANGATVTYTTSATYASDLTVGGGASGTLNLGTNTLTGSATGAGSGNFTMGDGATLGTTISSATAAGNVTTPGTVTIPAATTVTITVTATDYVASGTAYTIVDGAAGTPNVPNTITDDSTILSFAGSVSNNDLILTATRNVTYTTSVSSGSTASGAASTLTAISNSGPTGDMVTVLTALDTLSGSVQAEAIATTTPDVNGGATAASFTAQGQTFGTVSARLGDLRAGLDDDGMTGLAAGNKAKGVGIWLRGFGTHTEQRKREGVDGYRADTFGAAVGGDRRLLEDRLTLGLAYAYAGSNVNSTGGRDGNGTDVVSHQGTAYYSYDTGPWYVEGMANVGYNDYDSVRKVSIGTVQRTVRGDYKGWQYGAKVAGGHNIKRGNVVFTPTVSLQYSRLDLDGYTETGANALNLKVDDKSFDQLRSGLGARVAYTVKTGVGTFVPEVHAAYLYNIVADNQEFTSTYTGGGGAFNTEGADPARHGANVGASVALHSTSNITLSANYDAEFKDRFISHNGMLTVRYDF